MRKISKQHLTPNFMLDFKFMLSTHNINNARSAHATETPVLQALPTTLSS
jgi:hypothetical protein